MTPREQEGFVYEGHPEDGLFVCPVCGEPTKVLHEGYCPDCCEYRQAMLDLHNYQYDRWDRMTDAERDAEIRRAAQ